MPDNGPSVNPVTTLGVCDACRRPSMVRHSGRRWLCAWDWAVLFGEAML